MEPPLPKHIQRDIPLREYTTFGIGGLARYFSTVQTTEELEEALAFAQKLQLPFFILGKGSNCLFDDRGYNGLVILNKISFLTFLDPCTISVGAGYSFSLLGAQTAKRGLAGLEFASGIPASVGGAVYMNAGANGHETCQHLQTVDYVHANGSLQTYSCNELTFAYRSSSFQKMKGAIIGATFKLEPASQAREKQLAIIDYRKKTQPLKDFSAGCIFRNPPNHHSGALIEQCGLKGYTIGGAQISPVHANFIVNTGIGTADDVLKLIQFIQEKIQKTKGIHLEPEVKVIPYE